MPKISFIVPVYNVEDYLEQCIDSILNQTFTDFECILIDDGSTDKCPLLCDEYAKTDERIKVIHQKNSGVSAARNTGIEVAKGEWVYFVDSDDWLQLDAAEILYKDAIEHGADCVMSDCMLHCENGYQNRRYQFSQAFFTDDRRTIEKIQLNILCHRFSPYYSSTGTAGYAAPWGKFIKLEILINNNIRFDTYAKGVFDDGVYSLYLLDHVETFYYNRTHTYNYRINWDSITRKFKPDAMEILKRNYELVDIFIEKTGKDDSFKQAEACRRVSFFANYLSKYYFNLQNPLIKKEIKKRILSDLNSWPYKDAFRNAKYRNLGIKHRYVLFCGRHRCYAGLKLYAACKRILTNRD